MLIGSRSQYPPGDQPETGEEAFVASLRRFLTALDAALDAAVARLRRVRTYGAPPRRPRVFWLTVTGVSSAKLPKWKRPRMSAQRARR